MLLLLCDIVALFKAAIKIEIWEKIKLGSITIKDPTWTGSPDERIVYWTNQRDRYITKLAEYTKVEIFEAILTIIPSKIFDVIRKVLPW